jgi:hypothetical protein
MRTTIKTSDVYSAEGNEPVCAMRCLLNKGRKPMDVWQYSINISDQRHYGCLVFMEIAGSQKGV